MLLFSRRFLPFFITQFFGAFTDNLYKNALLVYLTLHLTDSQTLSLYTNLSMALFIFPMFLFSAWSGLLADRFEKRFLIVRIKWLEVFIMAVGILAFVFDLIPVMVLVLCLLGPPLPVARRLVAVSGAGGSCSCRAAPTTARWAASSRSPASRKTAGATIRPRA